MNLVTADSAKKIEDEVKVHYIRTTVRGPRKQRDAERFLFGGRKGGYSSWLCRFFGLIVEGG